MFNVGDRVKVNGYKLKSQEDPNGWVGIVRAVDLYVTVELPVHHGSMLNQPNLWLFLPGELESE